MLLKSINEIIMYKIWFKKWHASFIRHLRKHLDNYKTYFYLGDACGVMVNGDTSSNPGRN